jgi:hypothetical protein
MTKNCKHSAAKEKNPFAERGSATLECAFIAPIALLCACLLIYAAIMMFERAQMLNASDFASFSAAATWWGALSGQTAQGGNRQAGLAGGDTPGTGLYRRMADTRAGDKIRFLEGESLRYFHNIAIPRFTDAGTEASCANGLLGKTVTVALDGATNLPNRQVMNTFGFGSRHMASDVSVSLVADFPEFIRNADLVMDAEKKLEEASPEFKAFADGFDGYVGKIRGFIGGLF